MSSTGSSGRPSLYEYFFLLLVLMQLYQQSSAAELAVGKKLEEIVTMLVPALEQLAI